MNTWPGRGLFFIYVLLWLIVGALLLLISWLLANPPRLWSLSKGATPVEVPVFFWLAAVALRLLPRPRFELFVKYAAALLHSLAWLVLVWFFLGLSFFMTDLPHFIPDHVNCFGEISFWWAAFLLLSTLPLNAVRFRFPQKKLPERIQTAIYIISILMLLGMTGLSLYEHLPFISPERGSIGPADGFGSRTWSSVVRLSLLSLATVLAARATPHPLRWSAQRG